MSYKQTHEQFVSGHNGTSVSHISAAVAGSMLPVFFRDLMTILLAKYAVSTGVR